MLVEILEARMTAEILELPGMDRLEAIMTDVVKDAIPYIISRKAKVHTGLYLVGQDGTVLDLRTGKISRVVVEESTDYDNNDSLGIVMTGLMGLRDTVDTNANIMGLTILDYGKLIRLDQLLKFDNGILKGRNVKEYIATMISNILELASDAHGRPLQKAKELFDVKIESYEILDIDVPRVDLIKEETSIEVTLHTSGLMDMKIDGSSFAKVNFTLVNELDEMITTDIYNLSFDTHNTMGEALVSIVNRNGVSNLFLQPPRLLTRDIPKYLSGNTITVEIDEMDVPDDIGYIVIDDTLLIGYTDRYTFKTIISISRADIHPKTIRFNIPIELNSINMSLLDDLAKVVSTEDMVKVFQKLKGV